jgi:hypothetical protein
MKILLILLLFISTLSYSQRIEEVDGKYKAKIEYSVNGKSIDFIFNNANYWLKNEFPKIKLDTNIYMKSKNLSAVINDNKLKFHIEISCYDGYFITKFSDFYIAEDKSKQKKISKINQYLFELSGRMQKYIRYNEIH